MRCTRRAISIVQSGIHVLNSRDISVSRHLIARLTRRQANLSTESHVWRIYGSLESHRNRQPNFPFPDENLPRTRRHLVQETYFCVTSFQSIIRILHRAKNYARLISFSRAGKWNIIKFFLNNIRVIIKVSFFFHRHCVGATVSVH